MLNQCYSPIEKKQMNLGIRSQAFPLLQFSPVLESWSDIYSGPTSCLIVSVLLFVCLFCFLSAIIYISVFAQLMVVLCTEHSLLPIMSRHASYCWLVTSLFWYSAQTQFSKAFLKKCIPHLLRYLFLQGKLTVWCLELLLWSKNMALNFKEIKIWHLSW